MLTLYKSLVMSRLEYASQLWSPYLLKHMVQNGSPGSTRFYGPVPLRRYWSVPVSTGPYILGRPVKFSNSQDADNLHTIRKRRHVTRRQRPAAPSTSRPLPSVSRSVGTTTCVVDVWKPVVATKSTPQKKDKKSNKPSSPKVSPVHESDAYFTVKTYNKEKSKGSTPVTSVKISPSKFKTSILNKERLKRLYQASDFHLMSIFLPAVLN